MSSPIYFREDEAEHPPEDGEGAQEGRVICPIEHQERPDDAEARRAEEGPEGYVEEADQEGANEQQAPPHGQGDVRACVGDVEDHGQAIP